MVFSGHVFSADRFFLPLLVKKQNRLSHKVYRWATLPLCHFLSSQSLMIANSSGRDGTAAAPKNSSAFKNSRIVDEEILVSLPLAIFKSRTKSSSDTSSAIVAF